MAFSASQPGDNEKLKDHIKTEAKEVARLFSVESMSDITKSEMLLALNDKKYDLIHFSNHGMFNLQDPLSSGVIFHSSDGKMELERDILTAREIFGMRLNSKLVTLSACETGLNKIESGDNLLGFTHSFLHAGASSVLVSLWSVNAESTKDLMIEFYRQVKDKQVSKAVALQRAMIKIMDEVPHTYYWAGFVLIGDWR